MDAPKQCTEMRFGWTKRVTIPAWVYGFIANGDTFQVAFAVFTSGTYGNLGFLEPMHIGESEDDSCLAAGSYGVSMLGAGGGSSWAPVETPSEVWAEARGAVVGSVLGAAALIALLVWYFLRCVRAVRGNYAIDLQDEGEVEPLSALEALVTPLAMSRRSTSIGKKDMSVPRLLSEGYTAAQLSGVGHLDAGEAGPSTHTWEPENDAAYADAVLKKRPSNLRSGPVRDSSREPNGKRGG
ncbi:hypothetical protein A1Q1_02474 [Trichosporon asahii var. asahii CBS 2479]|uniref:Uncharacterized protein n=1 Tax=Trichosporon asahii var. asahii (strain ATCC 90039 / CBS 2479 / JCM 2466 / KCTC 7840 / NBRC 103889/ NCYC 2677 / UAMH 7654) TaxID=1186058 RepID=J5QPP8_TRIAS|nr:hypothetical protein A1Q1_02474 [Trichosporon asahii var. asahii CBS 2479]EJT48453.1 hypothetical protein A1Q1_02474 [Trichosporon asahii var. asahii CBS 2479]